MVAYAEAGPLNGTVCPTLISLSLAPVSYFFWAQAGEFETAIAITAIAARVKNFVRIVCCPYASRSLVKEAVAGWTRLLALEAGLADQAAPFVGFVRNELAEFRWRAAMGLETLGQQLLFHLGIGQRTPNAAVQPIDDRLWCGRGRHEAIPAGGHHIRETLFTQRGCLRIDRAAIGRGGSQHAKLAGRDIGQCRCDRGQRRVDTTGQQFRIGGR